MLWFEDDNSKYPENVLFSMLKGYTKHSDLPQADPCHSFPSFKLNPIVKEESNGEKKEQDKIEFLQVMSEFFDIPVGKLEEKWKDFIEEKPSNIEELEDDSGYIYSIFDITEKLTEGEVAIGKKSGMRIRREDKLDRFIDEYDIPVFLSNEILFDIFRIEEEHQFIETSFALAINAYRNKQTIKVKHNDVMFEFNPVSEDSMELIPFDVLTKGQWYVKESSNGGI